MQQDKKLAQTIAIFHLGPVGDFVFRATTRPQFDLIPRRNVGEEQVPEPHEIGEEWILEVIGGTAWEEREVTKDELMEFANCQDTVNGVQRFVRKFGPPFLMSSSGSDLVYAEILGRWKGLRLQFCTTWDRFIGIAVENDFTRSVLSRDYPEIWKAQPAWKEVSISGKFALRGTATIFVADTHYAGLVAKLLMVASTGKLRKCRNPGCSVTPYFIADHGKAQFCCEECARWGQREAKKKYWREHQPQSKLAEGNTGKKPARKKGSGQERRTNVARKTR
jgi:hypothetical protein